MEKLAIKTTNLTKKYSNKIIIDNINIKVPEGQIFGILGPNGAGKTTLIKMLTTLTPITQGDAYIFGLNIKENEFKIKNLIGVTGQYATVDEDLTAMENLVIFGKLNGLSRKVAKERGIELLQQFSLLDNKDKLMKNFSGGMRRRIDLAISLIIKPKLIFLDEPTTGLDPRTRGEMWAVIRNLASDGATIILTTQYLDEADQLADNIIILDQGKIVSEGTPEQLKKELGETYFEINLLNGENINEVVNILTQIVGENNFNLLPEQNQLSIKIADTKIMTNILKVLDEAEIGIKEFSVRKPTLDEVFLELTGNKENHE